MQVMLPRSKQKTTPKKNQADDVYENLDAYLDITPQSSSYSLLSKSNTHLDAFPNRSILEYLSSTANKIRSYVAGEYEKLVDEEPLPAQFDYSYSLNAYYWRTAMLVCLKLGQRLGTTRFMHSLLGLFFSPLPLAIIVYCLLPLHLMLIHKKFRQNRLNTADRRLLLLATSMVSGVLSSHLLIHYTPVAGLPPPYFMPIVVGLTMQLTGPQMGRDRRRFLFVTLGATAIVSLLIADWRHSLSPLFAFSLSLTLLSSVYNLQSLIWTLKKGTPDMVEGLILGLVMTLWVNAFNLIVWGRYSEDLSFKNDKDIEEELVNTTFF